MKRKEKDILDIIKKNSELNLKEYNLLIKEYGKETIYEAFKSILKNAQNTDINNIIDRYYIAYISIDIDGAYLDYDCFMKLLDKYGENIIIKYMKQFLSTKESQKRYSFIYWWLMNREEQNYSNKLSYGIHYNQLNDFSSFSQEEEKRSFRLLNESIDNLKIAKKINNLFYFDDIFKVLMSITDTNLKSKLYRIKEFLCSDDKIIVDTYLKFFKDLNGGDNENLIFPDKVMLEKKFGISIGNSEKFSHSFISEQLDYIYNYITLRNFIFDYNTKLVVYVAQRYINSGIELEDLISEGNIGLLSAIENFDFKRGIKFSTYAVFWIKHMILRDIANNSRLIRIPTNIYDRITRFKCDIERLTKQFGYIPSKEEIAMKLNMSTSEVTEYLEYLSCSNVSLDDLEEQRKKNIHFGSTIHTDNNVAEDFEKKCLAREIMHSIDNLSNIERDVITKRFGFLDKEHYSLGEIAKHHGLSREGVRKIERRALLKLKSDTITDYYFN